MLFRSFVQFLSSGLRLKPHKPAQALQEMCTVLDFFRNLIKIIRGTVGHKQFAIAVVDYASEGRNSADTNAIILRFGAVGRTVQNLQKPQPQDQNAENNQHKECRLFELFVKNSYRDWIEI